MLKEEELKSFFIPRKENNFWPLVLRPKPLFWYGAGVLCLKIMVLTLLIFLPATDFFSTINSPQLLSLINNARQSNNLSPLAANQELNLAADLKISDMAANNYFEHISPRGVTPWYWIKKAGYAFSWAGENLAKDFYETSDVFTAWMNSPGHRANILNADFKEIGIAVKEVELNGQKTTVAVLTFGAPASPAKRSEPAKTAPKSPVAGGPSPSQPPKKTDMAAAPKIALIPSAVKSIISATPSPAIVSSPTPAVNREPTPSFGATPLSLANDFTPPKSNLLPSGKTPLVLGLMTSRLNELSDSLYIYFTLFLTIALVINILVKINIQRWAAIFATGALIGLCVTMILI